MNPSLSAPAPVVHLVDDDPSVLRSLGRMLDAEGIPSRGHASAEDFLAACDPSEAGCLVLDIGLPALDGLDLQTRARAIDPSLPVVFLTGQPDIPTSVRAMKGGALDFLTKPVDVPVFVNTLRAALDKRARTLLDRRSLARLSAREIEVLGGVARGLLNKQIADALGISEKTVKVHRANGLIKLGVHSVADLMTFAPAMSAAKFPEVLQPAAPALS